MREWFENKLDELHVSFDSNSVDTEVDASVRKLYSRGDEDVVKLWVLHLFFWRKSKRAGQSILPEKESISSSVGYFSLLGYVSAFLDGCRHKLYGPTATGGAWAIRAPAVDDQYMADFFNLMFRENWLMGEAKLDNCWQSPSSINITSTLKHMRHIKQGSKIPQVAEQVPLMSLVIASTLLGMICDLERLGGAELGQERAQVLTLISDVMRRNTPAFKKLFEDSELFKGVHALFNTLISRKNLQKYASLDTFGKTVAVMLKYIDEIDVKYYDAITLGSAIQFFLTVVPSPSGGHENASPTTSNNWAMVKDFERSFTDKGWKWSNNLFQSRSVRPNLLSRFKGRTAKVTESIARRVSPSNKAEAEAKTEAKTEAVARPQKASSFNGRILRTTATAAQEIWNYDNSTMDKNLTQLEKGLQRLRKLCRANNDVYTYRRTKVRVMRAMRKTIEAMLTVRRVNDDGTATERCVALHNSRRHLFTLKTYRDTMRMLEDFVMSGDEEKKIKEVVLHKQFELQALQELAYMLEKAESIAHDMEKTMRGMALLPASYQAGLRHIFRRFDKLVWLQQKTWQEHAHDGFYKFRPDDNGDKQYYMEKSLVTQEDKFLEEYQKDPGVSSLLPLLNFAEDEDDVYAEKDANFMATKSIVFENGEDGYSTIDACPLKEQANGSVAETRGQARVGGDPAASNKGYYPDTYTIGSPNLQPLVMAQRNRVSRLSDSVKKAIEAVVMKIRLLASVPYAQALLSKTMAVPIRRVGEVFYTRVRLAPNLYLQSFLAEPTLSLKERSDKSAIVNTMDLFATASRGEGSSAMLRKKFLLDMLAWSMGELDVIVLYVFKLLRMGTLLLALYVAHKVMAERYVRAVHAQNKAPPLLFNMLLLMLSLDACMHLVLVTFLVIASVMIKHRDDNFVLDDDFIWESLREYFLSTLLILVIGGILSAFMVRKRYFSYRGNGLHVLKAYAEILMGVCACATIVPFFRILA